MNYAMSFIRPIDPHLEEVIIEVATSHKIRLNIARVSIYYLYLNYLISGQRNDLITQVLRN